MNAFEKIIDKHVGAFKDAITNDIRVLLMGGGGSSKPAKARAPKAAKAPKAARKERTTLSTDTIDAVVYQVTQHADGVATGVLAKETGLDKITTAKVLKIGIKNGLLRKTGDKRSTLYFGASA